VTATQLKAPRTVLWDSALYKSHWIGLDWIRPDYCDDNDDNGNDDDDDSDDNDDNDNNICDYYDDMIAMIIM
jgi:hypothetical protein